MDEQENVQLVQQAYANFKEGNIQGVLNLLDNDVDWFKPGPEEIIPMSGRHHGREGVAQFFHTLEQTEDVVQFEPQEFLAKGDKVVVLGNYSWRIKSTERTFASDWVHVFTLRGGKIVKFQDHYDTYAEAQAFGAGKSASKSRAV